MIFKTDKVLTKEAILYRYNTKKNLIEVFYNTIVLHRQFGSVDYFAAFPPKHHEGIAVNPEELNVSNKNGTYFYFWTTTEPKQDFIYSLFLKASEKYYTDKINELQTKIDIYNNKLTSIKDFLIKELSIVNGVYISKEIFIDKTVK